MSVIQIYEPLYKSEEVSTQLKVDIMRVIVNGLGVEANEIKDIQELKKGMTNHSFIFTCKNKKYIMRIPGEGTDSLINRREEAAVYEVIGDKNICDDIRYINPSNGYKITEFLEDARACDADNVHDLELCMRKLKAFHDLELRVEHEFDIFAKIDFYESLWGGCKSVYRDYEETKERVKSLQNYVEYHCTKEIRLKIYCYIAMCGLLWSNWCEYKRNLGVEFGEYSLRQYRYAKEYYKKVDWMVTLIPFACIIGIATLLFAFPTESNDVIAQIRFFLGDTVGVCYLMMGMGVLLVSIYLAFFKYGNIVLGEQGEKPKYSFFTWGSMMFTCGLAADILFYSFAEWVMYAKEDVRDTQKLVDQ